MKTAGASLFQWPKLTVSFLLGSSEMDTVVTYYRILNLASNVNDEDLRLLLEEQHHKEKAGLLEDVIRRRLRTRICDSSSTSLNELGATGENSDTCSICKAEFKEPDIIASLYYCPHEYHADCIFGCLLNCNICPLCQALAIIPDQYPDWIGDICLHQGILYVK